MLEFRSHVSLKPFNTFGIDAIADRMVSISSEAMLREAINAGIFANPNFLLLGGGSNVLLTGDYHGTVVRIENKGIEIISENEDFVRVKVAAGENWHDLVTWSIERGYGGLENLSLIPGNVGSSPIQNIGAYGVEMKDSFVSLEAIDLAEASMNILNREDCCFGYRDSIFKHELKGKVVIWTVTFRLSRNPSLQLDYGVLGQELGAMGVSRPGVREVGEAVCRIRRSKLPDPSEIGNAGSFFKNPVVSAEKAEFLRAVYPDVVSYLLPDGSVKLAAGWLIEQCRWKGFRKGDAGVHPKQALVLVNYGNASGKEIVDLSVEIQQSVLEKFDVFLETEVNLI